MFPNLPHPTHTHIAAEVTGLQKGWRGGGGVKDSAETERSEGPDRPRKEGTFQLQSKATGPQRVAVKLLFPSLNKTTKRRIQSTL